MTWTIARSGSKGDGIVCDELEFSDGVALSAGGGEGHLIVVSDEGGAFVWEPSESGCPEIDDFINISSGLYGGPALTDGWAVVPEFSTGSVLIIELNDMTVTNPQRLDGVEAGDPVALIAEHGSIWYNDPASEHAGLIRRDGSIVPISKYEEGATGFTEAPVEESSDDVDEMVLAGSDDREGEEEVAPEVEEVAGPELTTTTAVPSPTVIEDPEPLITTSPVEPDTTDTTPDSSAIGDTTPTTTTAQPAEPTTTTAQPAEPTTTTAQPAEPRDDEVLSFTIGVSASSVAVGETINFTALAQSGTPISWSIEVSPVGPVQLPIERIGSIRVRFPAAGSFIATMEACDAADACTQRQTVVSVVDDEAAIPLIAAIDGSATVVVGESASFRDISQGNPDLWRWSTDGGTPASSSSQNMSTTWTTPGLRTVTLTVGRGSDTDAASFEIEVVNAPTPQAFGLTCSTEGLGSALATCQLDGDVTDFSDISFSTDADGMAGFSRTSPSVGRLSLQSEFARTVVVTLTALDLGTGERRSDTATVVFRTLATCQAVPELSINGVTNGFVTLVVEAGSATTFTGAVESGCPSPGSSPSWSATGGGVVSNPGSASTSITWATPGSHTVTFRLGAGSTSEQVSVEAVVEELSAPVVSINGLADLEVDETGSYSFTNSGGPITSQSWTTNGGGGSGSDSSLSASWSSAGSYFVTLNVTGPGGTDTATLTVDVTQPQRAPFLIDCSTTQVVPGGLFSCSVTSGNDGSYSTPTWETSNAGEPRVGGVIGWSFSGSAPEANVNSTITVEAWTTDLDIGLVWFDSFSIDVVALAPNPISIGCDQSFAEVGAEVSCTLTSGNAPDFVSPIWTVTGQHVRSDPSLFSIGVAGTEPGSTLTVTLSATDTGTGFPASASTTITINEAVPPPPPTMSIQCSMLTEARARCTASNSSEFSNPVWTVSGDGALNFGGDGAFVIEVGTSIAGSVVNLKIDATLTGTGDAYNFFNTVTIPEAT